VVKEEGGLTREGNGGHSVKWKLTERYSLKKSQLYGTSKLDGGQTRGSRIGRNVGVKNEDHNK